MIPSLHFLRILIVSSSIVIVVTALLVDVNAVSLAVQEEIYFQLTKGLPVEILIAAVMSTIQEAITKRRQIEEMMSLTSLSPQSNLHWTRVHLTPSF